MKIISLQVENVKRLKAVSITPDGSVVRIKGNNAQGKTSVLDSILLALGGKSVQPPKVIREGEEHAEVVLDLGDFVVTRRWTDNTKSYLDVKSREGAKFPSPQAMLDKLVGALSFDPLAFTRMDAKTQAATARAVLGVDTTELDQQRQAVYEKRTEVNRTLAQAKARLATLPDVEAPEEEVSIAELVERQQRVLAQKNQNDRERAALKGTEAQVEQARRRLDRANAEVERLKAALVAAEKEYRGAAAEVEVFTDMLVGEREKAAALVDPDPSVIAEQLRTVEETNRKVRARKAKLAEATAVKELEERVETLGMSLAKIDADKAAALQAAKFPVAGLGFDDTGITLNGLPFVQASAAEQLRVSLAMGLAANPKLKVILIRDGSLLDEKSFRLVAEMAEQAGAQIWIEQVGTGGNGILIEDGQVASVEVEQPAA